MHSAVLGTAGYALLLSSLVSFGILFKRNLKKCFGSALHLLAMSDILSSVLTAILLIFNQYQPSNGPFTINRKINNTVNNTWMEFMNINERAFINSLDPIQTIEDQDNYSPEETSVCNFKDVIMHYAMFIFPFANAFISLLSFSVLSCVDMKNISTKCRRFMNSCEENTEKSGENVNSSRKKNEMTVTGLGIAGQWLFPVLLTAVLQFAGYESQENMQRANMDCVYGINFPFENCHAMESSTGADFFNKSEYITTLDNDYIASIDSSRISDTNSSAADEEKIQQVVSNVYQIIGSMQNFTSHENDTKNPQTFYDASQLMDITKFMGMMDSTEVNYEVNDEVKHEKNHEENYEVKHEINLEVNHEVNHEIDHEFNHEEKTVVSDLDTNATTISSSTTEQEINPSEELALFESLLRNSSVAFPSSPSSIEDDQQSKKPSPEVSNFSDASNNIIHTIKPKDKVQSNKKIFADIVKKIQAVSTQLRVRDKNSPVRNNLRARSQNLNSKFSFVSENRFNETRVCKKMQCYLSTRFLKIHLLILVFLVYFIPILISAILHTQAKYACQSIKEKMKMKATVETVAGKLTEESAREKAEDVSGPSGWFPASISNENEISSGSLEDLVCPANFKSSDLAVIDKHINTTAQLKIMNSEMCVMENLSEIFKSSLLFAVLLWTPTFIEVLSKVFLCMSPSDWLMNTSFLAALLFGILRNILNLRMIRAREIVHNDYKKDNSVFPTS